MKTIELSATPVSAVQTPSQLVSMFLDWLVEGDIFDGAVLAPEPKLLRRGGGPWVILTARDAAVHKADIVRISQSGFSSAIAARTSVEGLQEFFGRFGYQVEGNGTFGDGGDHDPLQPAWNKDGLEQAVAVASRISKHPLCIFGHDVDPLYLLCEAEATL